MTVRRSCNGKSCLAYYLSTEQNHICAWNRDVIDKIAVLMCGLTIVMVGVVTTSSAVTEEDVIAFAVVSDLPKDKTRIPAKVAIDGTVTDMKLLASDQILSNLVWKKLEVCHALKLEGQRSSEGLRVQSVRAIDGAMLPMVLQGFAGDCLLKKALEVAPFVD
jgi:hypothetical protein